MYMVTKLGMVVTYHEEGPVHKAKWSLSHMILWGHVKN